MARTEEATETQVVDRSVALAAPGDPVVAQKVQSTLGAANEANAAAMSALNAELDARTMRGEDGRVYGPLAPCTIINLNPCWLRIGGGMKINVPPYDWQGKEGKNKKVFERGGRQHVGHVLTIFRAETWLSPGGVTDYVDVGWAQPTLTPRYMTPAMACWHIWREYMTAAGSAQLMGGVLIFDGDIHELDRARLEKSKGTILVPEGFAIKNAKGRMEVKLQRRSFDELFNKVIEYQKDYLNRFSQRAFELFNSKDEEKRNQITEPMRRWGRFGVEVGYLKETVPWMMELPDAFGTAEAMKTCPVCRETSTEDGILLCPSCRAPYNAECTVQAVKAGYPVAESFIDALDDKHYAEVTEHLKKQAERRREREKLAAAK